MPTKTNIKLPNKKIAQFCKENNIRKLSIFGSVLRDDFAPDSDLDVLIEFEQGTHIGLIGLAELEIKLSEIVGRKVDLNTPGFLSKYYRDSVLSESRVQYVAS